MSWAARTESRENAGVPLLAENIGATEDAARRRFATAARHVVTNQSQADVQARGGEGSII
jgi:hypothetical protein